MIHRDFVEPNFRCRAVGPGGSSRDWITHADSRDDLERRLRECGFTRIKITDYDFSDWKARAVSATDQVLESVKRGERPEFKDSMWKQLKEHLFELFDGKCAYCESKVRHVASGDVEHYRPKRRVEEDDSHPGYYWLAYCEQNLLPCCEACNRARGKLNHFPVSGPRAVSPDGSLEDERPELVNPYEEAPQRNFKYLTVETDAEEAYLGLVEGETSEGRSSVVIYHLNRFELVEERRLAQERIVQQVLYCANNPATFQRLFDRLRRGTEEYSLAVLTQAYWYLDRLQRLAVGERPAAHGDSD